MGIGGGSVLSASIAVVIPLLPMSVEEAAPDHVELSQSVYENLY